MTKSTPLQAMVKTKMDLMTTFMIVIKMMSQISDVVVEMMMNQISDAVELEMMKTSQINDAVALLPHHLSLLILLQSLIPLEPRIWTLSQRLSRVAHPSARSASYTDRLRDARGVPAVVLNMSHATISPLKGTLPPPRMVKL